MNERRGSRLGCAVAIGTLVFTRFRDRVPPYVALHRWLAELGVSDTLRSLDASLLMVLAALLCARLAGREPLTRLGLRGEARRGVVFGLVVSLPMFAVAAVVGRFAPDAQLLRGAVLAPFVEELFFRGALVAIVVRAGGAPFWPAAIASSLLFGSVHVPWNDSLGVQHVGTFAITAVGGLWYAWLLREHRYNLWLTIALHAGMNASWLVFDLGGGAVGSGMWPNVGRAATIALGTIWTLRMQRRRANTALVN